MSERVAEWGEWTVTKTVYPDRTCWEVLQLGWVVAEAYLGPAGWRCSRSLREPVPDEVFAILPEGAVAVIRARKP